MARYSIDGRDTNTAATTMLGLTATAATRAWIYDIMCGGYGTPADYSVEYYVQRYTATGTSTGVTPQALDPADPAAVCTAGEAHSAEPTYTANAILLTLPKNMRATLRWVAAPGGEIVLPAAANNGAGILVNSVSTAYTEAFTMHFIE